MLLKKSYAYLRTQQMINTEHTGLQGYGLQGLLNFTAYLIALAIQFWHE